MKIDIQKSLQAPFKFATGHNWIIIYLIATVFTFIGNFNFNFTYNAGSNSANLVCLKDIFSNPISIVIAIILTIAIIMFLILRFICNCFTAGYIIKTMKLATEGNDIIMPEWKSNMWNLFARGFIWQLVLFFYFIMMLLIPIVLFLLGLIFADISFHDYANPDKWSSTSFIVFAIASLTIFLIEILIFSFLMPVIYARYAKETSFLAAFNIVAVMGTILFNFIDYIIAIVTAIIISFASIIISCCLCCTCIGIFFIPVVMFFILPIIVQNMFAQILTDK